MARRCSAAALSGGAAAAVALVAVISAAFPGRFAALPRPEESALQYASRVLELSGDAAEALYWQALGLLPRSVLAAAFQSAGGARTDAEAPKGTSPQHDELKQRVAQNEDEIQAQQDISARRYARARAAQGAEEALVLPVHPDEVRQSMPSIEPDGPEMRCGEPIPTHSTLTTRGIEMRARSEFQGSHGGSYMWKYVVTFHNHGEETVQMLTRHWVFIDEDGLVTEVKGPGARGVTPVLPPGGEWSYESGTSLQTRCGSMYGSFQFEVLRGGAAGARSFSARVGRLLLTSSGKGKKRVPCADAAAAGMLPLTSVFAVERVILGGRASLKGSTKDNFVEYAYAFGNFNTCASKAQCRIFEYDVQFNNARDSSIEVVGHTWKVVDSFGNRTVAAEGAGVGGVYASKARTLQAGDAFRVQGRIASATPEANAQGFYRVIVTGEDGLPAEVEARTDYMGLAAEATKSHVPNFVADPRFR